jgi:hypothetical protein
MSAIKPKSIPTILQESGFERFKHHSSSSAWLYRNYSNVDGTMQVVNLLQLVQTTGNLASGVAMAQPAYHIGCGLGNDLGPFDVGADPVAVDTTYRRDAFLMIPEGGFRSYMLFNSILQLDIIPFRVQLLRMLSYNCIPAYICQDIKDYINSDGNSNDKANLMDLLEFFSFFGNSEGHVKLSDGKTGRIQFNVILGTTKGHDDSVWLVGMISPARPFLPDQIFSTEKHLSIIPCDQASGITHFERKPVLYVTSRNKLQGFALSTYTALLPDAVVFDSGGDCDAFCFDSRYLPITRGDRTILVVGDDHYLVRAVLALLGFDVYWLSGLSVSRITRPEKPGVTDA